MWAAARQERLPAELRIIFGARGVVALVICKENLCIRYSWEAVTSTSIKACSLTVFDCHKFRSQHYAKQLTEWIMWLEVDNLCGCLWTACEKKLWLK